MTPVLIRLESNHVRAKQAFDNPAGPLRRQLRPRRGVGKRNVCKVQNRRAREPRAEHRGQWKEMVVLDEKCIRLPARAGDAASDSCIYTKVPMLPRSCSA